MLNGTYEGKPVHSFALECKTIYVTRGSVFAAAVLENGDVAVLAPQGLSYRQSAARAAALFYKKRKEVRGNAAERHSH